MECKQAHHSNWIEWRKAGWVRIIVKKQTAILKLKFITFTWELMQKACELELSLKCSMKMLSHLSLEKWGPLDLLLQWSKYQLVISSQLQYFVFYLVFILRGRWAKFMSLPSKYEITYYVISGTATDSLSRLFFWPSDCSWSDSSSVCHNKNKKMVNKPHKFTFLSKAVSAATVCLWSKINQSSVASVHHPHHHEKNVLGKFYCGVAYHFHLSP